MTSGERRPLPAIIEAGVSGELVPCHVVDDNLGMTYSKPGHGRAH